LLNEMIRFFLIFLLLIFCSFSAFAKDYKIEELLEIADQNSANIKAADFQALAQKHFANQQKYWNNPIASFGRVSNSDNYSISQSVPFYGKLQNKYDIEEAQFRILEMRRENTALFVKAEVFSLLYQYQALKRKIELTQKRLDRLASVDKYLVSIALNSPTKKAQGYITKDRIKLIERDLITYRNQAVQVWNRANVFLNLENAPDKIAINWLDGSNYKGREFLINAAVENNLELKEQKLLVKKFKSELAYSKIEQMPDVNVSITQQNSTASANSNNNNSTGAGISLSIPLINRNQEKIASDQSKIKAQEYELEFRTNQLIKLINNDLNEYEVSLDIAKKFPISTIDKSLKNLSEANGEFKRGVLDFITYLELDSQEYQMIDTVIDTQVQVANSYAGLMTKIGNFILPDNGK
jgi:outer membrane protein TolC